MDIVRLYDDQGVDYVTEGHKHSRPGWVNTECPFCSGNDGYHLGWNMIEEYFYCWRCGWHPPVLSISKIINVSQANAVLILKSYGINRTKLKTVQKTNDLPFILPTNMTELTKSHAQYIESRGFDPKKIVRDWGIKSTGPLSKVGNAWYKHRIFIPYYMNGEIVTFDTRDVTGKADEKYKACPIEREILERKKIVYGNQEKWTDTAICVEGPMDVWRFGFSAIATSGINFKPEQVKFISRTFKNVFIAYDARSTTSRELQAKKQARLLRSELRMRGVNAEIVNLLHGDPANMSQKEADKFVQSLLR